MQRKQALILLIVLVPVLAVSTFLIRSLDLRDKKNFYPAVGQVTPTASTEPTEPSQNGHEYAVADRWGYTKVVFTAKPNSELESVLLENNDGGKALLWPYIIKVKSPGIFFVKDFDWGIWEGRFEIFKADTAVTQPADK